MLAMRRLGPAALALAFVLVAPGLGSADIVARGVDLHWGQPVQVGMQRAQQRIGGCPSGQGGSRVAQPHYEGGGEPASQSLARYHHRTQGPAVAVSGVNVLERGGEHTPVARADDAGPRPHSQALG